MKLFKFRSIENNTEFTLDIILNSRLYCAHHRELNDPFEGLFSSTEIKEGGMTRPMIRPMIRPLIRPMITTTSIKKSYIAIDQLFDLDSDTRVCSMSSTMKDVRMWSLYADAHTGCVVEIEIENETELSRVTYGKGLQKFENIPEEELSIREILSYKTKHWEYEREYRIITCKKFYSIKNKISAIYLGTRTKQIYKDLLIRITPSEIPIYETALDKNKVEITIARRIN